MSSSQDPFVADDGTTAETRVVDDEGSLVRESITCSNGSTDYSKSGLGRNIFSRPDRFYEDIETFDVVPVISQLLVDKFISREELNISTGHINRTKMRSRGIFGY